MCHCTQFYTTMSFRSKKRLTFYQRGVTGQGTNEVVNFSKKITMILSNRKKDVQIILPCQHEAFSKTIVFFPLMTNEDKYILQFNILQIKLYFLHIKVTGIVHSIFICDFVNMTEKNQNIYLKKIMSKMHIILIQQFIRLLTECRSVYCLGQFIVWQPRFCICCIILRS